ncbi:MAG: hypothetical protein K6G16_01250 [Lachnospiraceae bacterium]|nr:hypothetical protein [Lachnospiraceae bacterium]
MLHFEYRKQAYKGSRVDILPGHISEIPDLRDMLMRHFLIDNPARTFARKYRAGGYDGWPEEEVTAEAEMANTLADLWEGEATMNVMALLSRAMQMIFDLKKREGGPDGDPPET